MKHAPGGSVKAPDVHRSAQTIADLVEFIEIQDLGSIFPFSLSPLLMSDR